MKKLATAIATIALIGTPALAADMAVKAPAPSAPAPISWTGWYGGFNFGGTWSDSSINTSATNLQNTPPGFVNGLAAATASAQGATVSSGNRGNNGPIGGAQIGYNWQFYTNWVAGFEADIQGVGNARSQAFAGTTLFNPALSTPECIAAACAISTNMTLSSEVDWLGTVRGRLGWLAWPSLLVYGTGGLAYGEVKAHTTINQAQVVPLGSVVSNFGASSSISQIRTGWTAGGGFELMLAQNWSAKIEYLYYDLGTGTSNALLVDPSTTPIPFFTNNVQTTTHFNGNIVRVGLNYQFH
jgi:outer membrane immunogenic protein